MRYQSDAEFFEAMRPDGEVLAGGKEIDFTNDYKYTFGFREYWLITGTRDDACLEKMWAEFGKIRGSEIVLDSVSEFLGKEKVEAGCLWFSVPKPVINELLSFLHLDIE